MKENRTYDQVLGDLKGTNGDPRIVVFPYPVTPNHHRLASQFVALDNFYTSGDVSSDGWNWSQQGRANEYTMRVVPLSYASQAIPGDFNGQNRGINTAEAIPGGHDPFDARITSLLDPTGAFDDSARQKDVAATVGDSDDSPNVTGGYIWDSVLARRQERSPLRRVCRPDILSNRCAVLHSNRPRRLRSRRAPSSSLPALR